MKYYLLIAFFLISSSTHALELGVRYGKFTPTNTLLTGIIDDDLDYFSLDLKVYQWKSIRVDTGINTWFYNGDFIGLPYSLQDISIPLILSIELPLSKNTFFSLGGGGSIHTLLEEFETYESFSGYGTLLFGRLTHKLNNKYAMTLSFEKRNVFYPRLDILNGNGSILSFGLNRVW